MIHLDFSVAVSLYIFIMLAAFFLFWLFSRKEQDKDLSLNPKCIWFCSVCTYTFVNTRDDLISVCPRCGSYNKKSS